LTVTVYITSKLRWNAMASISAERLVTHGLFPENLPSVLTTRNIWANLAPGSTTYAVTARAVGEICPYDASKRGGQRRVFGVPHPLYLRDQGLFFENHWTIIEAALASSPGSVSKPVLDAAGPRHIRITPHSDLNRIRLKKLSRFAFCLVADVSRFFPSIYSHSIPWALNGKPAAKLDHDPRSTTVWGNRLDFSVRQAQSGQRLGIPVGTDTSKIVAEIIMSSVDKQLLRLSGAQPPTYVRHVDDYWIGGHTIDECERHLRHLRTALKEHSLDINELKTKIISTKLVFGDAWPSEIERAIVNSLRAPGRGINDLPIEDPIAMFGMIIERAVEANDDGIIRKAIRVLDRRRLWENDWEILEHFLAQCAVQFPHSFDYVARVIAWRLRRGRAVDRELWIDISRHTALHNGGLGRDSEACWAIWLLKERGSKLLKPLTDVLAANLSPLTLAFLAHFPRHRMATDRRLLQPLRDKVSGDPFSGSFWPLSLELEHLGAGDPGWASGKTPQVLRTLHLARASIIDWNAAPKVFTEGVGQEPDLPDEPDFAIEDIGSDYIGDHDEDDEADKPVDVEDLNFLSPFQVSDNDLPF
jgi:Reverse transcriptase (RNA-dependent DNA polymerase)